MVSNNGKQENGRLIVLVPDSLVDDLGLARKAHWLAIRYEQELLFLTLVDEEEKMLAVSRRMATMKAIASGNWLVVQSRLTETTHWLSTLREIYHPGDRIVCHEEQLVKAGFLKTQPLSEYLANNFGAPTCTLSGFYQPGRVQALRWLNSLAFWIVCLLIIAGFGYLEFTVDHGLRGFARLLILSVMVVFEFGLLWAWNKITKS